MIGHHQWLACERVAHHGELVPAGDQQRKETVELLSDPAECLGEVVSVGETRTDEARADLCVVIGVESDAERVDMLEAGCDYGQGNRFGRVQPAGLVD